MCHVAAVSALALHDVCRSISAPCHIMFLRVLPRPTAAFLALPCSALLSRLGRIGFVACHVTTFCVDHGSSATSQLELDYTCSSGRSLCSACMSCPGLCCMSCCDLWPCAGAELKQLLLFTCHVLLWCLRYVIRLRRRRPLN